MANGVWSGCSVVSNGVYEGMTVDRYREYGRLDDEEMVVGPFVMEEGILGQGSYGKVRLARHRETGRPVAIKTISKDSLRKPAHVQRIRREVRVLKLLSALDPEGRFFVKLEKVVETRTRVILVMEYIGGGELVSLITRVGRLDEYSARQIFRHLIAAVALLHRSFIVHRDLKPQNILLASDMSSVKLIDFGFTNLFEIEDGHLDTFCGSPFYASPEMVSGTRYRGPEVDIWSLGVILYSMLVGRVPFNDTTVKGLYSKIIKGTFEVCQEMSPLAFDLISRMLCVNPHDRASAESIMVHPWVIGSLGRPLCPAKPLRVSFPLENDVVYMLSSFFGIEEQIVSTEIMRNPVGKVASVYSLLSISRYKSSASRQSQRSRSAFVSRLTNRISSALFPHERTQDKSTDPFSFFTSGTIFLPEETDVLRPDDPDEEFRLELFGHVQNQYEYLSPSPLSSFSSCYVSPDHNRRGGIYPPSLSPLSPTQKLDTNVPQKWCTASQHPNHISKYSIINNR